MVWGPSSILLILILLWGLYAWLWRRSHPWDLQHCTTDLTGKTAVVTGASSGIGKAVSQELARRGARVILACRNRERGQQALAEIQKASSSNCLLLGEVDLSSVASIRSFVRWLLQEEPEIHLLVNNAGITGALHRAGAARVVNVTSYRQKYGYIDEEHLTGAGRPLSFNQNYDCSKLQLISFTGELAQRLRGTGVTVNSVDPGIVYTNIMKHLPWPYRFSFWLFSFFLKDPRQGAVPVLYLSLAQELDGVSGKYFSSSCVITLPAKPAQDPYKAQSLWNASVRLTNLDKMD
ncbi:retinol dehydrogenase 11-like isoform X2 [Tamandua tetradactyla]|uniref:retinol dehydrogenase 11-like isoform X2 n=1 Tax=Tamandua tetradactyla TaxID=48850 RepID=UPI0040539560